MAAEELQSFTSPSREEIRIDSLNPLIQAGLRLLGRENIKKVLEFDNGRDLIELLDETDNFAEKTDIAQATDKALINAALVYLEGLRERYLATIRVRQAGAPTIAIYDDTAELDVVEN